MRLITAITAFAMMASPAFAATAFYKGEFVSGQNKICIYEFLGSQYYHTIRAYAMCPYSIKV